MPRKKPVNLLAPLIDELGDLDGSIRELRASERRAEALKKQLKASQAELPAMEGTTLVGQRYAADLSAMGERDQVDLEAAHRILGDQIWTMVQPATSQIIAALPAENHSKLVRRALTGPRTITCRPLPTTTARKKAAA